MLGITYSSHCCKYYVILLFGHGSLVPACVEDLLGLRHCTQNLAPACVWFVWGSRSQRPIIQGRFGIIATSKMLVKEKVQHLVWGSQRFDGRGSVGGGLRWDIRMFKIS